jgi:hypothetical protein
MRGCRIGGRAAPGEGLRRPSLERSITRTHVKLPANSLFSKVAMETCSAKAVRHWFPPVAYIPSPVSAPPPSLTDH